MSNSMIERTQFLAHGGWVTAIATSQSNPNLLLTSSRDKSIIVWNITHDASQYATPIRALKGHNHFVSDIAISSDGNFALSGSWDKTLRLWEIATGKTTRRFVGHAKEVLSVAFSSDNRQIVSSSRDHTVKLWNTLGECKHTFNIHNDWVSCVRFPPIQAASTFVTASWDGSSAVQTVNNSAACKKMNGHSGYLNTVTISPDGSLCATGGKDGVAMLWDLSASALLYTLEAGDVINSLVFSPSRYWLVAATNSAIKIWDLESKNLVADLRYPAVSNKKSRPAYCVSLSWSQDGTDLYAGFTDNKVHVYSIAN